MSQLLKALRAQQNVPELKLVEPIDGSLGNIIENSDYLAEKHKGADSRRNAVIRLVTLATCIVAACGFLLMHRHHTEVPVVKAPAPVVAPITVQTGVDQYKGGNADSALKTFLSLLPDAKNNATLLIDIGMTYEKKGDLKSALDYFKAAVQADPKNAIAYNNLGMLEAKKGQTKSAINDLRTAIKLDENTPEFLINLASVFEKSGLWAESLELYSKYLNHPRGDAALKPVLERRMRKISSLSEFEKRAKGDT